MKKKAISIICLFLTVTMLTGMFPVSVSAADSGVITGTFTYMPSFVDAAATDTFYYSDGWFSSLAAQQNDHLRTMSMVLALASMEIEGSTYITKLYNDLGYTDIRIDEMNEKPTANTIGTAIAHKRIDGRDVVALSIRGNKYGAEWASNLLAGAEGNIEGFDSAAGKVIDRLKSYIAEHQLSSAKLWIAGYSRAGSVADLLGVYINEHLDEFSTAADDVYVYCFEAPRCCASDKVYPNMHRRYLLCR